MIQRNVPPRLAVYLLSAALVCAVLVEGGAYYSGVRAEARITARHHLPTTFCVSCHTDAHSIQVMRDKEDRQGAAVHMPGGFLDPDGVGAHALPPSMLK
jgi:hypothetical protein